MKERMDFSIFNKYVEFFEKKHIPTLEGGYELSLTKIHFSWGKLSQIMPDIKSRAPNQLRPWTHRLIIRYYEGTKAGQRLVIEDKSFTIDLVVNLDETNSYQELRLIMEVRDGQYNIY